VAAYAALPAAMQVHLLPLRGRHQWFGMKSEHPLVTVHPETNEVVLGLYPIVTSQYSATTLYSVSDNIQ
jgi:hypothetical protein